MDFSQDSLFNLTPGQIAGVLLVGLGLCCLWLLALKRLLRRARSHLGDRIWLRVLIALVLAWLYEWLSPQVYYAYYYAIIDGLPIQWVAGSPPWPRTVLRLLLIEPVTNLSELGRALLYWLLLLVALLGGRRSPSSGRKP